VNETNHTLTIATWNINSIRARLERLTTWLDREQPDVVCLQETKVVDDLFPGDSFRARGYHLAHWGQKAYNGVAIAARQPLEGISRGFAHGELQEARLLTAVLADSGIRIINVYVPNGGAPDAPRFTDKLTFLDQLIRHLEGSCDHDKDLVLTGDFNIAPAAIDVFDAEYMEGKIGFHPQERAAIKRILDWGLIDAFRLHHREGGFYSWWDYRGGAFHRDRGLRIDHILLTRSLAARCRDCTIQRDERKGKQPSDHAPVIATLQPTPIMTATDL
jgi:exodeoxyribonuclease-3